MKGPSNAVSMTERPPPLPDDLAALAAKRIREALEERQADRAARDARQEARRRHSEEQSRRMLIAVGVGLLVGALAVRAVSAPGAVGLGLLAGGGCIYVLRWLQSGAFQRAMAARTQKAPIVRPAVVQGDLSDSRRTLIVSVLDETAGFLRRLHSAGQSLQDREPRELCARLVEMGQKLIDAVARAPEKFAIAQRMLTYHLPKAIYLGELLVELQAKPDAKRSTSAIHVLGRMEMLLERTLLDLAAPDMAEMDLEMRLINQALDEDLDQPPKGRAE
jgi:hypothetical protein